MKNRHQLHLVIYLDEDETVHINNDTTIARFGEDNIYNTSENIWVHEVDVEEPHNSYLQESLEEFMNNY